MKLRKKDPRRRNRLRSRRTARKMLRRRRLAIVAALALVIGVGLLRVTTGGGGIWYQFWGRGSSLNDIPSPLKGDFVCEECDYHWRGEGARSHRYDPYVKCRKYGKKKARKAIQCPTCDAWVLPPIPEPPRPYAEMNKGEKDRWDREKRKLRREAVCPRCGAPIFR